MASTEVANMFGVEDVIVLDTEYVSKLGERVQPVCLCATSIVTRREWRAWYEPGASCPLRLSDSDLYITYSAPAEWSYFLAAEWDLPLNIIDLHAEYASEVNGLIDPVSGKRMGTGLLDALKYFGIQTNMGKEEKQASRNLISRGGPWTEGEKVEILDYCMTDVENTIRLFETMSPSLIAPQALNRGDFTRAVATYDFIGIPVDMELYERLRNNWTSIKAGLAQRVEKEHGYGVYRFDGNGAPHWSDAGFADLVKRRGLEDQWPRTNSGKYKVKDSKSGDEADKAFRNMGQIDPHFEPLRQTRRLLNDFKRLELPVGTDGRCRPQNLPFSQRTGRSSPKRGSIFAMPAWARCLVKPQPGRAIAYVDLTSAEFGIAGALSGAPQMLLLYDDMIRGRIEDVYLQGAKLNGAATQDATRSSHREVRKVWKIGWLATQYGASPALIALITGTTPSTARGIHYAHHKMFSRYWDYIDRLRIESEASGVMMTRGGWKLFTKFQREATLANFPIQAHGGEIMRLATSYMVAEGVQLCTTVHDAVLVESSIDEINAIVELVKRCWRWASLEVVGVELGSDAKVVRYPDRYMEDENNEIFDLLLQLLKRVEEESDQVAVREQKYKEIITCLK